MYKLLNNKQISHAFLFNIRKYSSELINIQRREAKLSIILPRVNNFNIEQKKAWNICFIICHQHQTRSGKIKTNKTQQISAKTQVFFCKNWTTTYLNTAPSKSFYIIFAYFFSEIINPWKNQLNSNFLPWNWQFTRAWREIKQENMIHIYDGSIIDVTRVQ